MLNTSYYGICYCCPIIYIMLNTNTVIKGSKNKALPFYYRFKQLFLVGYGMDTLVDRLELVHHVEDGIDLFERLHGSHVIRVEFV